VSTTGLVHQQQRQLTQLACRWMAAPSNNPFVDFNIKEEPQTPPLRPPYSSPVVHIDSSPFTATTRLYSFQTPDIDESSPAFPGNTTRSLPLSTSSLAQPASSGLHTGVTSPALRSSFTAHLSTTTHRQRMAHSSE